MLVRKIINLSSARLILQSCVKLIEIVTKKSKSAGGIVAAGQELFTGAQSCSNLLYISFGVKCADQNHNEVQMKEMM